MANHPKDRDRQLDPGAGIRDVCDPTEIAVRQEEIEHLYREWAAVVRAILQRRSDSAA